MLGKVAPSFKVISANKEVLTLSDIKGKVAVLFYEAKEAIEQNRKLKTELNIFYGQQPEYVKKAMARLSVIDCQGVMFKGAWEDGLRENSRKEGMTIYGDWDGKMSLAYHFRKGESNVIIISREGIIRYYVSGEIKENDIGVITELLKSLIEE